MARTDGTVFSPRRPRMRRFAALMSVVLAAAALVAGPGAAPAEAATDRSYTKTFSDPQGTRWTTPSGVTRIG